MLRASGRVLVWGLVACTPDEPGSTEPVVYELSREELLDPETCAGCHPAHTAEWQASMHAYAADDPVFLAMNARGQRETDGALGDFCVSCHAPLAVSEGYTDDGLNLDEVPSAVKGVGCYFCHTVDGVEGDHNADLSLADDLLMRGPYRDPVDNRGHGSAYSPLLDRTQLESATVCGTCHDIVTPAGVHLERTYAEWRDSQYALGVDGLQQTCGNCHMDGRTDVAAEFAGVPERRVHSHSMPGVDVALDAWPDVALQTALVQDALDSTVWVQLEVSDYGGGTGVVVAMDNVAAGHKFPSGAAHDRRAWLELVARDADGAVLWSSGLLSEGQSLRQAMAADGDLWWFGDRAWGADGTEAHMFWDVVSVDSQGLPAPSRFAPGQEGYVDPHVSRTFHMPGVYPQTVEARIHIRPIGLDVLQDLVDSGDLDAAVVDAMPTFTLAGSEVIWTAD